MMNYGNPGIVDSSGFREGLDRLTGAVGRLSEEKQRERAFQALAALFQDREVPGQRMYTDAEAADPRQEPGFSVPGGEVSKNISPILSMLAGEGQSPIVASRMQVPGAMGAPNAEAVAAKQAAMTPSTTRQPTAQEIMRYIFTAGAKNPQLWDAASKYAAVNTMAQGMSAEQKKRDFIERIKNGGKPTQSDAMQFGPEVKASMDSEKHPLEMEVLKSSAEKARADAYEKLHPKNETWRDIGNGLQQNSVTGETKPTGVKAVPKGKVAITDADGNITGYADAAPSKTPTPQQAGTLANISTGVSRVADLKKELFSGGDVEKGTINRRLLSTSGKMPFMNAGVPGTDGRTFRSDFMGAADAIVRARTGAAMTKEEAANMEAEYLPSFFDKDTTIRAKIRKMDEFLSDAQSLTSPYRGTSTGAVPTHNKVLTYDPATGGFK